ncbi:MAG: CvpA family protein [Lachnospiraceae bacterium]|nr:CvpA family protein [Lachnospiraceae bacterium]
MNIVLIVAGLITLCTALNGYKKGMIDEIISLVTLIAGLALLATIVSVISNYIKKDISDVVIGVIIFVVIVLLTQVAQMISKGLRIIFQLPVISGLNKIAGFALGIVEGIILIWVVFILLQYFQLGAIETRILQDVEQNDILTFLYQNNYLKLVFHTNIDLSETIKNIDLPLKIG